MTVVAQQQRARVVHGSREGAQTGTARHQTSDCTEEKVVEAAQKGEEERAEEQGNSDVEGGEAVEGDERASSCGFAMASSLASTSSTRYCWLCSTWERPSPARIHAATLQRCSDTGSSGM